MTNAAASVVQSTQYYPFGSSFADATAANAQPYKYNGKELDVRNELNMYDYSARWKDDFRFTTVDPLAEKKYWSSPYAYCLNNPLKYIDPDGCSTHTDSLGNVVAVYDDWDLGVYKHNISRESYDGEELLAKSGVHMGTTEFWNEFINPETNKEFGTINFGESWDNVISELSALAKDMDVFDVAAASKTNRLFDIKVKYKDEGRLLNGKYASTRSAGNYLAGYNAAIAKPYLGIFNIPGGYSTFQKLAGALHVNGSLSIIEMIKIVHFRVTYGPAPTYGENNYQYRQSIKGWSDGKK